MARLTIRNPIGGYHDGGEAELLAIVGGAEDRSSSSEELLAGVHDWVTRYHLSTLRANVLRPLTFPKAARILEVGAGTGVLTRWLGEQGHTVVAVEGALARAEVIAARCDGLDQVEVVCGGPDDVATLEPFDLVLLIGVLEYAGVGGLPEAEALLDSCARLVAPGGALVVAIENQLGLQYLAGGDEDHRNIPGVGVEGYVRPGPRTYSRRVLQALVAGHGLSAQRVLYPFPDYKLPSSVLADRAFDDLDADAVVALARRLRSTNVGDQAMTFDLAHALRVAVEAGIARDVANSFVLVAARADEDAAALVDAGAVAWLFGDERRPRWSRTRVVRPDGDGLVVTAPDGTGTRQQDWLTQQVVADRPFTVGRTLGDLAREACWRSDGEALDEALAAWRRALDAVEVADDPTDATPHPFRSEVSSTFLAPDHLDVDLGNFVVLGDGTTAYIDDEWVVSSPVDRDLVGLRSLWSFARGLVHEGCAFPGSRDHTVDELALELARRAGLVVDASTLAALRVAERELQQLVLPPSRDGIDQWLDGSATVTSRVEAGRADASRAGEALLDAWASADWFRDHAAAIDADRERLIGERALMQDEITRLTHDWHAFRARIAALEERLHGQ